MCNYQVMSVAILCAFPVSILLVVFVTLEVQSLEGEGGREEEREREHEKG